MPDNVTDLPTVPVQPIGDFVRGPTNAELGTWDRLLRQAQQAGRLLDICALQFQNAVTAHNFAQQNNIDIQIIPPELEQRYINIRTKFERLRKAIRGVENHTLGVNFRNGDIDIVAESPEAAAQQGFDGLPLVILGVVVIAASIAVAAWATKNAIEVINQARALVKKADDRFCQDPNSALCADWEADKAATGFKRNDTIADTIKTVGTVGKNIALGLLLLLGVGVLWRQKS